jgi:molecular chaperone HscB
LDPFAILGIAPSFDVDLAAVEQTHRELSRALHPDRYVGAGPSERREALTRAMEVNEAWRILRDPIRRAEALLRREGVAVSEDRAPPADPEFLMEMLEQREALSEAIAAKDRVAVARLAAEVRARADLAERAVADGFAAKAMNTVTERLGELRFFRRFLDEVSAVEDEL